MGTRYQWQALLTLTLWTATGAAQDASTEVAPRKETPVLTAADGAKRPTQVCIVEANGERECLPLASLPSRELIERTLMDYRVETLRCDPHKKDAGERVAPARKAHAKHRRNNLRPGDWSSAAVERAEQNILALLRSCRALDLGLSDPVELGNVPAGAEPWPVVVASADEAMLPPAETVPAVDAPDADAAVADAPVADVPAADVPVRAPVVVNERPDGVRIVEGYRTLRPAVTSLLITYEENVDAGLRAQAAIDPCSDPIGMPALGECEFTF